MKDPLSTDQSDIIEIDGEVRHWPKCSVPGCSNRSCLRLNSPECYPHTALSRLRSDVEAICHERATTPVTRARLRHAIAEVDWRKAR